MLLEVELLPLRVQNVQVVGQAVFIAVGGESGGQMGGGQRAIEVAQTFLLRSIGSRRVVDLLHRGQDRLLVGGQLFARRQIRDLDLGVERPEIEEGPVSARPDRGDPVRGADGIRRTNSALGAARPVQEYVWEQLRNRNADARGGPRDATLGLRDVRTSPQQIDRPAGWNPPRQGRNGAGLRQLLGEIFGVRPQQNRDGVTARVDLRFERRHLGLECRQLPSGQRDVQFAGDPAVEEGLRERLTGLGDDDVLPEDGEARLFGAHIEIVPGDIGRDHHHHPIPRGLEGLDIVGLRLVCAADPAEEIEIPIRYEPARFLHAFQACAVYRRSERRRHAIARLVRPGSNAAPSGRPAHRKRLIGDHHQRRPRLLNPI